MISTGNELRIFRETQNISQARLAEILGIPQHLLSSFELGKTRIDDSILDEINHQIANLRKHSNVIERKKRYVEHEYSDREIDPERAKRHAISPGNKQYLVELNNLCDGIASPLTAIGVFSGIGGFSLGFKAAGFNILGCIEIEDKFFNIYRENFPDVERLGSDVTRLDWDYLKQFISGKEIDAVIGGPPCQGFSLSGKRDKNDARNQLFRDYIKAIDVIRPKVAVIENVRLLTSMKGPDDIYVKDQIREELHHHGYKSQLFEVNTKDYGVPQHRERVFFIAVREDLSANPSLPEPEFGLGSGFFAPNKKHRTFADACSDLQYIESGQSSEDSFHKAVAHPDHVLEWLWDVKEGFSAHDNKDPKLRPPSGYNTTYKRQIWNEPASTVQTTFGMISGCRNVHPIATRSLTVREAARIQSFSDSFRFVGPMGAIRTGIGNAVPPLLAKKIALHLRSMLSDFVEVSSL